MSNSTELRITDEEGDSFTVALDDLLDVAVIEAGDVRIHVERDDAHALIAFLRTWLVEKN